MDTAPRFDVRKNRLIRRWRVVLIAANGEPLSTSESLNSEDAVITNINSQKAACQGPIPVFWPDRDDG